MTPTNTHVTPQTALSANPGAIVTDSEQSQLPPPKRSRVHWYDVHLGTTGFGGLHTDAEAHEICNRLDALSPYVKHWVEKDLEATAE
jgi:hypothetical protein